MYLEKIKVYKKNTQNIYKYQKYVCKIINILSGGFLHIDDKNNLLQNDTYSKILKKEKVSFDELSDLFKKIIPYYILYFFENLVNWMAKSMLLLMKMNTF